MSDTIGPGRKLVRTKEELDELGPVFIMPGEANPTLVTYGDLTAAYDWFNRDLFADELPRCLITYQRQRGSYGYFSQQRFGTRDGAEVTHEIALNPKHFRERDEEAILSTLAHEMVHLWQHEFGQKKSRAGYHNKEWATKMKAIGLHPSSTAQPGGKETGQRVGHYVIAGGPFQISYRNLIENGPRIRYIDLVDDRQGRGSTRTKYVCPFCGLAIWGQARYPCRLRGLRQCIDGTGVRPVALIFSASQFSRARAPQR